MKGQMTSIFHGAQTYPTSPKATTDQLSAAATIMSNLNLTASCRHNLFDDFEEELAMLMSMEDAAGLAVSA